MSDFFADSAFALFITVLAGLVRILRGPTRADRMLAVQLFGTSGVAILLLLAQAYDSAPLNDVALVFTLLTGVATIAFIRLVWSWSPLAKGNIDAHS